MESGELTVEYLAWNCRDFTKMASAVAPFYVIDRSTFILSYHILLSDQVTNTRWGFTCLSLVMFLQKGREWKKVERYLMLSPHLPSALLWKGQGNQNDFVSEAVQLSLQRHLDFVCATLSTTNCGKFFKRWEYQTITSASWEIYMQVKKQQLELDMEQWTGSKLRKEYLKAVYCHPAYLTYMQSTSCEMPG